MVGIDLTGKRLHMPRNADRASTCTTGCRDVNFLQHTDDDLDGTHDGRD